MTINTNRNGLTNRDVFDQDLVATLANEIYATKPNYVTAVKKSSVEIISGQLKENFGVSAIPQDLTERKPVTLPSVSGTEHSIRDTVSDATLKAIAQDLLDPVNSSDRDLKRALVGLGAAIYSPPHLNSPGASSQPSFYFLSASVLPTKLPAKLPDIFDIEAIRRDFPVLQQKVNGKQLIWFDNAATTQKPQSVINALSQFYEEYNSNIHRGVHTLAAKATDAYEDARTKVQKFLGAGNSSEIIFVRGTTEAINLVAQTYGRQEIGPGDEILLTTLEHHANIVPWQMLAQAQGAVLKVVPVNDRGEILLAEYGKLLSNRTKIVGLTHVSNAIGTVLPVAEMTEMAHHYGARVLIDGAQSVSHFPVNVQSLNCDFYTFSGHKIFGPTGIGVLYGKQELLDRMPPWQGGGSMIRNVTFEHTTYSDAPAKFEAGTPNIGDAIGLGAALDYLNAIGLVNIERYEQQLTRYATERLLQVPGLHLIGTASDKVGVLSFILDNLRTEEVGKKLDREAIAVRSGHHCAQPTMQRFGVTGTVRPALAFYNTCAEIDRLVEALLAL